MVVGASTSAAGACTGTGTGTRAGVDADTDTGTGRQKCIQNNVFVSMSVEDVLLREHHRHWCVCEYMCEYRVFITM